MVQQVSQFRSPHAVPLLFTSPLLHSAPHPAHHLLSITLAQWKIARFSTIPGLIHFCVSLQLWGDFLLCRDRVGSYEPASDSLMNRDFARLVSEWIFTCWTLHRHFPHRQTTLESPPTAPVCRLWCNWYSIDGYQAPLFLPLHPGLYSPVSPHLGLLKHPPAFSELPHVNPMSSMQQGSHLPGRTRCGCRSRTLRYESSPRSWLP